MAEESPITNPELYETIDKEVEGEAVQVIKKSKRKRKRNDEDEIPLPLDKLSGSEVVRIFDFLHKRYLSWMTEAESTKYATIYRSAKEEALKETLETYAELQKQNQALLERLEKLIERLSTVQQPVQPQEIAKETAQEIKKSILDDPRVRSLIFIFMESFLGNNETYKKMKPFIAQILIPEAFQQHSSAQETQPQHVESNGSNVGESEDNK